MDRKEIPTTLLIAVILISLSAKIVSLPETHQSQKPVSSTFYATTQASLIEKIGTKPSEKYDRQNYVTTKADVNFRGSAITHTAGLSGGGRTDTTTDYTYEVDKIPSVPHRKVVENFMPSEWKDFCVWDQREMGEQYFTPKFTVYIKCIINKLSHTWHFKTFHNFIRKIRTDDINLNFAIDIVCKQNMNISLPWPMKAHNLWSIYVRNCQIHDFMSEFLRQDLHTFSDYLNVLEITDSSVYVSFNELMEVMTNFRNVSSQVECGSIVLERFVFRNVTREITGIEHLILNPSKEVHENFTEAFGDFHRDSRILDHICNYKNLKFVDESIAEAMASYHMEVFSDNSRFPVITSYNLSHAKWTRIPKKLADWRLTFPKLYYLDLSHNRISSFAIVDHGKFSSKPGYIDLRHNNITAITKKELKQLEGHKTVILKLQDNPFRCNCDIKEFLEFLHQQQNLSSTNLSNYQYFHTLVCATPLNLKGRVIASLSMSEIGCYSLVSIIDKTPFIVLFIIIVIVLLVMLLLFKYRKEVIILSYTRLNINIPCQKQTTFQNKIYDGFISYSNEDSNWVLRTLLPRLERPNQGKKFKLCIHQRDFEIGAAIADNIVKSVETSRHTILVLSKHFLESEWCLMEFRTALHQGLLEKSRHLIMVVFDDFSTENIESDLKRCMKTYTYMKASDKLFWDKLVYSLSDNQTSGSKTKTKTIFKNAIEKVPICGVRMRKEVENNEQVV